MHRRPSRRPSGRQPSAPRKASDGSRCCGSSSSAKKRVRFGRLKRRKQRLQLYGLAAMLGVAALWGLAYALGVDVGLSAWWAAGGGASADALQPLLSAAVDPIESRMLDSAFALPAAAAAAAAAAAVSGGGGRRGAQYYAADDDDAALDFDSDAAVSALLERVASAARVADGGDSNNKADGVNPNADSIRCKNTQSGRHLVADDRGYVCTRFDFDSFTGCCKTKGNASTSGFSQYSCKTCQRRACCREVRYDLLFNSLDYMIEYFTKF